MENELRKLLGGSLEDRRRVRMQMLNRKMTKYNLGAPASLGGVMDVPFKEGGRRPCPG